MTTSTTTIAASDGTRTAIAGLDLGRRSGRGLREVVLVAVTALILVLVAF